MSLDALDVADDPLRGQHIAEEFVNFFASDIEFTKICHLRPCRNGGRRPGLVLRSGQIARGQTRMAFGGVSFCDDSAYADLAATMKR
jgi:hypothetical protein